MLWHNSKLFNYQPHVLKYMSYSVNTEGDIVLFNAYKLIKAL